MKRQDYRRSDTARRAYNAARNFVRDFDLRFQNLFLYGNTGVGKTFLSHCIAHDLLETSHCVLYFSAFDLFDRLAQTAFSRKSEPDPGDEFIFDCDLLIIDDLGTELTNSFVSSQLFLCINERIARRKSTIISTNLRLEDFSSTYSERTFSRIASNYQMLKLIGKDIRIQKIFLTIASNPKSKLDACGRAGNKEEITMAQTNTKDLATLP